MQKLVAELIGTFALVLFGTGAVIMNEQTQGLISHPGVSMVFGLIVMVMIYSFGNISGAHLNPAVTIAFTVAGRFPLKNVLPYVASQVIGALLASATLHVLFPMNTHLGATLPQGSVMQSFIVEMVFTFFLMLVIIHVATGSKEQGMFAGIAIGAVVFIEALVGGPISGASMNPARSIGPAIVSGNFNAWWIYLLAPVTGAVAAIPVYQLMQKKLPHNT